MSRPGGWAAATAQLAGRVDAVEEWSWLALARLVRPRTVGHARLRSWCGRRSRGGHGTAGWTRRCGRGVVVAVAVAPERPGTNGHARRRPRCSRPSGRGHGTAGWTRRCGRGVVLAVAVAPGRPGTNGHARRRSRCSRPSGRGHDGSGWVSRPGGGVVVALVVATAQPGGHVDPVVGWSAQGRPSVQRGRQHLLPPHPPGPSPTATRDDIERAPPNAGDGVGRGPLDVGAAGRPRKVSGRAARGRTQRSGRPGR
ncbi:hypothetical protein EDD28_3128 [Salana multivorans]|uniref:Uncharacterized protein n=1 Tax=Salana multivorans TaxID=120377 RepID=A0A3N2D1Q3_9MICO|nr:hypothetical protein EDD28_3128 [Salana multivorans]